MSDQQPYAWRSELLLALLFFLVTFGLYARAMGCPFLNFDDPTYVVNNSQVHAGLTRESIDWACTSHYAANWHPLTWLSLQLDYDIYGLEPAGFHRTNVLIHALNTALLFWVLLGYTRQLWPSALVAALFGWHPLHVESVVWITERKDVLSTFFWLLTMAAYRHYALRPSKWRYLKVVVLLALGLLAKPMVVTLPFVLLLLDYWPLQRVAWKETGGPGAGSCAKVRWYTLIIEKIPMLILVGIDAFITADAQAKGGAIRSLDLVPFSERAANAFVTYVAYLGQTFWPLNLGVFYPLQHPHWSDPAVIAAIALILSISIAAIIFREKCPYLLVGWFWYLGTLVPVIGIVQVGLQAMADRYTYVPLIGFFISLVWTGRHLLIGRHWARRAAYCVSGLVLILLMLATWQQVGYWRTNVGIWKHTAEVAAPSATTYHLLGVALTDENNLREGITYFDKVLAIKPLDEPSLVNRGANYLRLGEEEQAFKDFSAAVEANPQSFRAHYNLAIVYSRRNQPALAIPHYLQAIQLDPNDPTPHWLLGKAYLDEGDFPNAQKHLLEALGRNLKSPDVVLDLGRTYLGQGRNAEAVQYFDQVIQLDPKNAEAMHQLSVALYRQKQTRRAFDPAMRATQLEPFVTRYHTFLGLLLNDLGEKVYAENEYAIANKVPKWQQSFIDRARQLLTNPDLERRNARQALELAQQVCQASHESKPEFLDVLGMAYAELGDMNLAKDTLGKAIKLAQDTKQDALLKDLHEHLRLYQQRKQP